MARYDVRADENHTVSIRAKGRVFTTSLMDMVSITTLPSAPTSNTVYCGILQYVILPGKSVVSGKTITVTQTITTAIDYTTTTTPGPIGSTYSNSTTSTNTSGYSAGVETICKYISSTSSSK